MPDRHGPLRVARFLVEIDGIAKAGFSHCRLAASSTGVVEYREGNDPPTPRKLAGLNEYGPLTLEYGVTADGIELAEWHRLVQQGKVDEARRPVAVVLLDEEGAPSARWEFRNAWPTRYAAPTLDADRSAVAIETLEIVHEGVERVDAGGETDGGKRRAERNRKPPNGMAESETYRTAHEKPEPYATSHEKPTKRKG
jgi:phage tail-like protein